MKITIVRVTWIFLNFRSENKLFILTSQGWVHGGWAIRRWAVHLSQEPLQVAKENLLKRRLYASVGAMINDL